MKEHHSIKHGFVYNQAKPKGSPWIVIYHGPSWFIVVYQQYACISGFPEIWAPPKHRCYFQIFHDKPSSYIGVLQLSGVQSRPDCLPLGLKDGFSQCKVSNWLDGSWWEIWSRNARNGRCLGTHILGKIHVKQKRRADTGRYWICGLKSKDDFG